MDSSGDEEMRSESGEEMSSSQTTTPSPAARKRKKIDPVDESLLMAISEVTKPKSEFDLFGEMVGNRLESIATKKHPFYAAQARRQIDEILMQYEFDPKFQFPPQFLQPTEPFGQSASGSQPNA